MIIRESDRVRVLVPGKFQGQVVKVLQVKKRRPHSSIRVSIDYRLDTKWDGKPYPGWFGSNEIEKVKEREYREC